MDSSLNPLKGSTTLRCGVNDPVAGPGPVCGQYCLAKTMMAKTMMASAVFHGTQHAEGLAVHVVSSSEFSTGCTHRSWLTS